MTTNSHGIPERQQLAETVDFSCLFATRDRCDQLRETLDHYLALNTDGLTWELIVVDNGSTDDTPQVLRQYAEDLPLVALRHGAPGQNRARNQALSCAHGRFFLFTDDDVLPPSDLLQGYLAGARRWPEDGIFGARVVPRFPPGVPDWIRDPNFAFGATAYARYHPSETEGYVEHHPYGPSFCVRRDALGDDRFSETLGPQPGSYTMGGEGALMRQLRARGWLYVYLPGVVVEHVVRNDQLSVDWLISRAYKKGRSQAHLPSDKKPRRLFWRGVPVKLWLATARSWLRYQILRRWIPERRRAHLGIRYALRRGELAERLATRKQQCVQK